MAVLFTDHAIRQFLEGKSEHTLGLYHHLVNEFSALGDISLEATKTTIAISNKDGKRIAWITQLGKNFVHVVLPFRQLYTDNLCFKKAAQVPGSKQFNHHLRILNTDDLNEEVRSFMRLALAGEEQGF